MNVNGEWVKSRWDFKMPMALLFVTFRDPAYEEIAGIIESMSYPEEHRITDVIVKHQPHLAGGCLVGIQYDYSMQAIKFAYIHPCLPKTNDGDILSHVQLTGPSCFLNGPKPTEEDVAQWGAKREQVIKDLKLEVEEYIWGEHNNAKPNEDEPVIVG